MEKRKRSNAGLIGLTDASISTSLGYGVATGLISGVGLAHDNLSLLLNIPLSLASGLLAQSMFILFAMDKSFIQTLGRDIYQQHPSRRRIHLALPMAATVITGATLGTLGMLAFREGINTLPIDTNIKGVATMFEWALPVAAMSRQTWIQGREIQRMQNSQR